MKVLTNKTITDVTGILASGISCGIKKDGKKDLCIIYSRYKAVAAAVFTKNKVKAAPLLINMENIKDGYIHAMIVNSGNANSCTGEDGRLNATKVLESAAKHLSLPPKEVLIQSTGAIGIPLPMEIIIPGIEKACSELSDHGGLAAAEAILTTDTSVKTITVEFEIDGKPVMMSGIAKGSTMIHPDMATMFSLIVTDASISSDLLNKFFKSSVESSYNMISVDGDTSTNDMAVILANGASGTSLIDNSDESCKIFDAALNYVNTELAKKIAKDGEGSTKLLEVNVVNARSVEDAKKCAKSVASSTLVKCGMYGSYPVWQDIICSIGYSGANFDTAAFDIFIKGDNSKLQLVKDACEYDFDDNKVKDLLSKDLVELIIDFKDGQNFATAWGCDMGVDYIKANAYLNI
jgi:glutamate N-acetyltransferase / amino-acid N-acetyltransferase